MSDLAERINALTIPSTDQDLGLLSRQMPVLPTPTTNRRRARELPVEPRWYQRAIFYEMFVQACFDASGDGFGDLPGLTTKLDYLKWLGVDCLWLPPFYDSPAATAGTTSATTSASPRSSAPSTIS